MFQKNEHLKRQPKKTTKNTKNINIKQQKTLKTSILNNKNINTSTNKTKQKNNHPSHNSLCKIVYVSPMKTSYRV